MELQNAESESITRASGRSRSVSGANSMPVRSNKVSTELMLSRKAVNCAGREITSLAPVQDEKSMILKIHLAGW